MGLATLEDLVLHDLARRIIAATLLGAVVGCGEEVTPPPSPLPPSDPTLDWLGDSTQTVVVGAGDVGVCDWWATAATAELLDRIVGTVIVPGDVAYPSASDANFRDCYDPTWGRHKARTRPVPGNHEYFTPDAAGYFRYFGAAAGTPGAGYYSYTRGAWRLFALNSEIDVSDASAQVDWLRQGLAANPTRCALAYWHTPRFSSGQTHGNNTTLQPLWEVLYQAGVEVVINGHEHNYERFAPQTPAATADPLYGIRQFVVGTGGGELYPFDVAMPAANSEVREPATYGVLALRLRADGYDWRYVAVSGSTFADSGSGVCHDPPPATAAARAGGRP